MKTYEGKLVAPPDAKFVIVVSRFNEFVTSKVAWSPGSYEIPLLAQRLAGSGQYAAVLCIGAVIRGGTDHYQYVASEVSKGVALASLNTGVPCIFGVLTCDTVEQAVDRAGAKSGNKGADAASAAIEMVNLLRQLPAGPKR
jgi:6,7-dimethyl-8-ribityllumazine synthase